MGDEKREHVIDGTVQHTELSVYSRTDGLILAVRGEMTRTQVELTDASDMRKLAGFLLARAQHIDPLPATTPNPAMAPDQLT